MALLPNSFQENCIGSTAKYELQKNNQLKVINTCYRKDDVPTLAIGSAKTFEDAKDYQDRWLKVNFVGEKLPSFYSDLFSGDYLILYVEKESNEKDLYNLAIVGSIDKKYLWILSRSPEISKEKLTLLLDIIVSKGYDQTQLIIRNPLVYK